MLRFSKILTKRKLKMEEQRLTEYLRKQRWKVSKYTFKMATRLLKQQPRFLVT